MQYQATRADRRAHRAAAQSNRPGARMSWTIAGYAAHVVGDLGLVLLGWPPDVVFTNLSKITGLARIQRLYARWKRGAMRFVRVADLQPGEAESDPLLEAIARAGIQLARRLPRCDTGGHRSHPISNPYNLPTRYPPGAPKSAEWVTAEAEAQAEAGPASPASTSRSDPLSDFDESEAASLPFIPSARTFAQRARRGRRHGEELPEDPIDEFPEESD